MEEKLPTLDELNASIGEKPLPTLDELNSSLGKEEKSTSTVSPQGEIKTETLSNPYGLPTQKQTALDQLAAQKPWVEKINADPKDVNAKYNYAALLSEQGKYAQATNLYTGLVAENPESPDANYGMYYNLVHQGRDQEAQLYLENWQMLKAKEAKDLPEAPSSEEHENQRLLPYRQRLENAVGAIEQMPIISTAKQSVEGVKAATESFKQSAEAFEVNDLTKGTLKAIEGGMHAWITAMTATPEGALFFEALNTAKIEGVPEEITTTVLAPVSTALDKLGVERGENAQVLTTIADLFVLGKLLHAAGKPLSGLEPLKEPQAKILSEQQTKNIVEAVQQNPPTENDVISTLNNLDNPAAAKTQKNILDLQDEATKDAALAPLLQPEVGKLTEQYNNEKRVVAEQDAKEKEIVDTQNQISALEEKKQGKPEAVVSAIDGELKELFTKLETLNPEKNESLSQRTATEVLSRQSQEVGERGGERQGMGSSLEGEKITKKGEEVVPHKELAQLKEEIAKDISTMEQTHIEELAKNFNASGMEKFMRMMEKKGIIKIEC